MSAEPPTPPPFPRGWGYHNQKGLETSSFFFKWPDLTWSHPLIIMNDTVSLNGLNDTVIWHSIHTTLVCLKNTFISIVTSLSSSWTEGHRAEHRELSPLSHRAGDWKMSSSDIWYLAIFTQWLKVWKNLNSRTWTLVSNRFILQNSYKRWSDFIFHVQIKSYNGFV